MVAPRFEFTSRGTPRVQIGIGDTRVPGAPGRWGSARWDQDVWGGTEPRWLDVSCNVFRVRIQYGRSSTLGRFTVGKAEITVDNASGWADPGAVSDTAELTMRPGRAVRFVVDHATLGELVIWRGIIDVVTPTYVPDGGGDVDVVRLDCIDALGEVNKVKLAGYGDGEVGAGDQATARIVRWLDYADWPEGKRDLDDDAIQMLGAIRVGQLADLLGITADSAGGSVFGDHAGNICYRQRDWQTFTPDTPADGTIGNGVAGAVCPSEWVRPFAREDIATRAIMGRSPEDAVQVDDEAGRRLYGIEPYERVDLITEDDDVFAMLARRALRTRAASTAPRVRSVTVDVGATADLAARDAAFDLVSTVNPYLPSRYRCRLDLPRGTVFDAQYFATGVTHDITPYEWVGQIALDSAAPFANTGARWGSGRWDQSTWGVAS